MMKEKSSNQPNEKQQHTHMDTESEREKPYRNIEYSTNNCFECIESKNKLNKIAGKL